MYVRENNTISVVIPTRNEALAIGRVIADIPAWVDEVVVADNRSTDNTAEIARLAGAKIVPVHEGGYGAACLAGIAAVSSDIIVFVDGDYSDYPDRMDLLLDPICYEQYDLVIGSRQLGNCEAGSLTIQQKFGNRLACFLISIFWNHEFTDLGPFRAIRSESLTRLGMDDPAFGWTVQMQLRAIQEGLRIREVPVDYRVRIGRSKISGTFAGTMLAGYAIIGTILRTAFRGKAAGCGVK